MGAVETLACLPHQDSPCAEQAAQHELQVSLLVQVPSNSVSGSGRSFQSITQTHLTKPSATSVLLEGSTSMP